MGSQAIHDAVAAAPAAIVIETPDGWRIAEKVQGWQPDRFGGGRGPVVVTYKQAPGLPYRTEAAAQGDASLVLARST